MADIISNGESGSSARSDINNAFAQLYGITDEVFSNRGDYDASGNQFPETGGRGTSGAVLLGDRYRISVAGTLGGTPVVQGQEIWAKIDDPGQTSGNWVISKEGSSSFYDNLFKIISNVDDDKLSFLLDNLTADRQLTLPDISGLLAVAGMVNAFQFGGQAHSGYYVKPFSASATFNANNGNNQQMNVTASTTIAIINEVPGTFVITLIINTGTPPTIELGSSLGDPYDNNPDLAVANGDENTIMVLVKPNGTKRYTINTKTA
jgi:hypothetical protein